MQGTEGMHCTNQLSSSFLHSTRYKPTLLIHWRNYIKNALFIYGIKHCTDMFLLFQITVHSHKQLSPIHCQTFFHLSPGWWSSQPWLDCLNQWLHLLICHHCSVCVCVCVGVTKTNSCAWFNPFTAPACKIFGQKCARIHDRKQYIWWTYFQYCAFW